MYSDGDEQSQRATRENEWRLFLITLVLLCLSSSPSTTFAHSDHDYSLFSHEHDANRSDYITSHVIPQGGDGLSSSLKNRTAKEENKSSIKSSIGTHPRIRSNQHSLISVSVVIESEERSTIPAVLPSTRKDHQNAKKDEDGGGHLDHAFNEYKSNTASVRNNSDVTWTVHVEELHVGLTDAEKNEHKDVSVFYSEQIHLKWKKIKEVNEFVIDSNDDVERSSGLVDRTIDSAEKLQQISIFYSGTTNITLLIPLVDDDNIPSRHRSTPPLASQSRIFLVSLIKSTRQVTSFTRNSSQHSAHPNNHLNDTISSTLLTRRLATLPRNTYSSHRPTIDPVATVFLYHREEPHLSTRLENDISTTREDGRHVNAGDESADATAKNLGHFWYFESNFFWTLLLLSTMQAIHSTSLAHALHWIFHIRYAASSACGITHDHSQEFNNGDSHENVRRHDDGKEVEGVNYDDDSMLEFGRFHRQQCEETQEVENHRRLLSQMELAVSSTRHNAEMNLTDKDTSFSKSPRHTDIDDNLNFQDNCNPTTTRGDCIINADHLDRDNTKMREQNVENIDNDLENINSVNKKGHLNCDIARRHLNIKLTPANAETCAFNDKLSGALKPTFEDTRTFLVPQHKISDMSTDCREEEYPSDTKHILTTSRGIQTRTDSLPQIPHDLNYKYNKCDDIYGDLDHSIKQTDDKSNYDMEREEANYPKADLVTIPHMYSQSESHLLTNDNIKSARSTSDSYMLSSDSRHQDNLLVVNFNPISQPVDSPNAASIVLKAPSVECTKDVDNRIDREIDDKESLNETTLNHNLNQSHNKAPSRDQVGENDHVANSVFEKTNVAGDKQNFACAYPMERLLGGYQKNITVASFDDSRSTSSLILQFQERKSSTELSDLSLHKMKHNLGKSDKEVNIDLARKQMAKIRAHPRKATARRHGDSKQSQGIQSNDRSWKRNTSQHSETEESYVSTLPPDSDYASECSHFSRTLEPKSIQDSSKIERKQSKLSTHAQIRRRRNLSNCIDVADEKNSRKDKTTTAGNLQRVDNCSLKETDHDSVEVVGVVIPHKVKRRGKRPYRKSNYVADWVPSSELQSMSQKFLQEESWDIVTPSFQTSNARVPKLISLQAKRVKIT